jgi:hypothetical protein
VHLKQRRQVERRVCRRLCIVAFDDRLEKPLNRSAQRAGVLFGNAIRVLRSGAGQLDDPADVRPRLVKIVATTRAPSTASSAPGAAS